MRIEDLQVYRLAMEIGDEMWVLVKDWDFFAKKIIGSQLVRSADSIAANLSEGFGRYFYKENRQFCYYSRGSLQELKTWLKKAHNRDLISEDNYNLYIDTLDILCIKINNYIKSIGMINNK